MDQYRAKPALLKLWRALEPESYMARLREFGVVARSGDGKWTNLRMIYDVLHGTRQVRSLGNYYDLAQLSEAALEGTIDGLPQA